MGRKPKAEVLFHKGLRYTWSPKGYWRCTLTGDRHNLTRRLWEEAYGPIPARHKIFYKDGDRFNVSLSNLECLSQGEVQHRRMKDPEARFMAACCLIYGKLIWAIKRQLSPELGTLQAKRAWVTRRNNYGPSGKPSQTSEHYKGSILVIGAIGEHDGE